MPSTTPLVSTTEIVTWARLSSGRRIWARAALMILNASSRIARTSAAVSARAGVGAGEDRIAVRARAVGEDEGVGIGELGRGRGADARGLGAVGAAGEDAVGRVVIAGHRGQRADAGDERREGAARWPGWSAKSAAVASL